MSYNPTTTAEHITTTTTTTSIFLNKEFVTTIPGILKIIELVIDIIIWICVGSTPYFGVTGNGGYINFTATITFIFTMIFCILYLFNFIYRLPGPWILIESGSIILSIFFLTIALLVGAFSFRFGSGAIAAAVFCALNAVVYSVEMFLRFRISRSNGWTFTATTVDGDIATKKTTVMSSEVTTNEKNPGQTAYGDTYSVP